MKNKIFLFPISLAVIFFASIIIIFSPLKSVKIVNVPYSQPITISSPDLSQAIKSPLVLKGQIDSSWVFEGSFPIELFDNRGKSLFKGTASASNWTDNNGDLVDFTATIKFSTSANSGILEIKNDNPSGLPENDKFQKFSVLFVK